MMITKSKLVPIMILFVIKQINYLHLRLCSSSPTTHTFEVDRDNRPKEQQCPAAILDTEITTTRKIMVNDACPMSESLLKPRLDMIPSNKPLTYMMPYYNDHKFLAQHLKAWLEYSPDVLDKIEFVIIDDGSVMNHRAVDFFEVNREYAEQIDLKVYEIDQDMIFNIGGARNLGFWVANTQWVFMNDADMLIKDATARFFLDLIEQDEEEEKQGHPDNIYTNFIDGHVHPAISLMKRSTYWKVGGCDEDFVGDYGRSDPYFFYLTDKNDDLMNVRNVKSSEMMDKSNVEPLHRLLDSHDYACPEGFHCLKKLDESKHPREEKDATRNELIVYEKRDMGDAWSNDILRFTWSQVW